MFAEYVEKRTMREVVLCAPKLERLLAESHHLANGTALTPQLYNEFIQQAANWAGNLAGRVVGGIGNMVNNFKRGYQQGSVQTPQAQPGAMGHQWTGQQQNPYNQADDNELPLNQALHHLENLKQNIQMLATKHPKYAQHPGTTTDFTIRQLERVAVLLQQVLTNRYGGARVQFRPVGQPSFY